MISITTPQLAKPPADKKMLEKIATAFPCHMLLLESVGQEYALCLLCYVSEYVLHLFCVCIKIIPPMSIQLLNKLTSLITIVYSGDQYIEIVLIYLIANDEFMYNIQWYIY